MFLVAFIGEAMTPPRPSRLARARWRRDDGLVEDGAHCRSSGMPLWDAADAEVRLRAQAPTNRAHPMPWFIISA